MSEPTTMRRAAKVDGNQHAIVQGLRSIPGVSVAITATVGDGFPDLIVGWRGTNHLVELKINDKAKLTPQQRAFLDAWTGDMIIATSLEQIMRILEIEPAGTILAQGGEN